MGLEMHLKLSRYVYPTDDIINLKKLSSNGKHYRIDKLGNNNLTAITTEVGHWEKAYSIDKWFNDNRYETDYVYEDEIDKLYDICKEIVRKFNGVKFTYVDKDISFAFGCNKIKDIYFKKNLHFYSFKSTEALKDYCNKRLPIVDRFDIYYIDDVIKTILIIDNLRKEIKRCKKDKILYDITYISG